MNSLFISLFLAFVASFSAIASPPLARRKSSGPNEAGTYGVKEVDSLDCGADVKAKANCVYITPPAFTYGNYAEKAKPVPCLRLWPNDKPPTGDLACQFPLGSSTSIFCTQDDMVDFDVYYMGDKWANYTSYGAAVAKCDSKGDGKILTQDFSTVAGDILYVKCSVNDEWQSFL